MCVLTRYAAVLSARIVAVWLLGGAAAPIACDAAAVSIAFVTVLSARHVAVLLHLAWRLQLSLPSPLFFQCALSRCEFSRLSFASVVCESASCDQFRICVPVRVSLNAHVSIARTTGT